MSKTLRFNPEHAVDHKPESAELAKTLPKHKKIKKQQAFLPHEQSMKNVHGHFSKGMRIWPIQVNSKKKGSHKI